MREEEAGCAREHQQADQPLRLLAIAPQIERTQLRYVKLEVAAELRGEVGIYTHFFETCDGRAIVRVEPDQERQGVLLQGAGAPAAALAQVDPLLEAGLEFLLGNRTGVTLTEAATKGVVAATATPPTACYNIRGKDINDCRCLSRRSFSIDDV